uniref:palmitoyl-acyl carrier protein thioesterase, chloroplastic-like n=1 Tax=Erigeron canadensis TaxID=72917 RepID=UPI001CB96AD9|nr:palmitoyl-acyl carrier protein thioesterase, chloroplastic-like [Erigeron canadensis]
MVSMDLEKLAHVLRSILATRKVLMTSTTSFLMYSGLKAPPRVIHMHLRNRNMLLPVSRSTTISFKPISMMLKNESEAMLKKETELQTKVLDLDLGRMVNNGFVFRQNIHIKSYEVAPDATPTIETIMNHLQETSGNHLKEVGISIDGFATTPEMAKRNLFWVTSKMQVVVDRYPVWGNVVTIDTWKAALGKIGLCCNWTFSDSKTGEILIRASSTLVLVNKETRKLSKFPDEVRAELEQFLFNTPAIVTHDIIKWSKQAETIVSHVPLRATYWDLDVNQHVNNVKHSRWILESVPKSIIENYELASMALQYCHECKEDSIIESHTSVTVDDNINDCNTFVCDHLLLLENAPGCNEITKGRTRWRRKYEKISEYHNVGPSPNGNGGV